MGRDRPGGPREGDARGENPRVLIVSQTRLYREGLAEVLGRTGRLDICGHSGGSMAAFDCLREFAPDVVLLDAAIGEGPRFAAAIAKAAPQTCIVVIALAEAAEDVLSWAEAGAAGYIPQTMALADLAPAVLEIVHGGQACAPQVASALLRRLRELSNVAIRRPNEIGGSGLTARELQIARLINSGLSNKQIARQLGVGVATIKSHVHNLLGKLDLQRRGQVTGRLGAEFWAGEVEPGQQASGPPT
jgi:two-component system, NarL family, nitrate/nitrite response regulator NarL